MFTMHPTLLVGPADWDPARMPKREFLDRIAAFWRACDPNLTGVVVYGSPRDHAELAYLTHFTPKLESGIALIPRQGEPRLLVGGGVNMLPAAKPLTWVGTLLPLRDAGTTIATWAAETGGLVLINGDAMPFGLRQSIVKALGATPRDATEVVTAAMRHKSAREMTLIREACATLDAAFAAMRAAQQDRKGMTDVVLAGEHAAHRRGAQDVRSLFGSPLAPFTVPVAVTADPLQIYVAVRHGGYWAEGFGVLSRSTGSPATVERAILDRAIATMNPGVAHSGVAEFHSIGLAPQEPECLNAAREACFAASEVYTVRVGMREGGSSKIVSAMIAVTERGHEVLWPGARP